MDILDGFCYLKVDVVHDFFVFQSNEVNQGNALEHNFTSVYLAFLLPVKKLFNDSLDQVCKDKTMQIY